MKFKVNNMNQYKITVINIKIYECRYQLQYFIYI